MAERMGFFTEPEQAPEVHRPCGRPADLKHRAQFWHGLVADARPEP
ncbi:hypothetical protein ACFHYQ_13515 [Sphaerimonospora cavernae]|uniref:Uncharacterized protein n=1 Tax=Sphaerimonospora cavernae TaxID=1740611 RepID=A0ABV6U4G1_9ACTN